MSLFYRLAQRASQILGPSSVVARAARPVTERVIRWTVGDGGLAWDINGIPCQINPQYRAQMHPAYDADLYRLLRDKIRPGQTCLDVGANIGAWVIQFADMVGPTGRVVAFEPNPAARTVLNEHIRLNHLELIVLVVPAAVGAVAGEVTFFAAGSNGMGRIGEPNPLLVGQARPLTVPVFTLDGWWQESGINPDWLFLDVEGFEGHALSGAANLIRSRGPALGIVVEMHPSLWPASGTTGDEIAAQIAAVDRRAVPLTGQTDPFADYGQVLLEPI